MNPLDLDMFPKHEKETEAQRRKSIELREADAARREKRRQLQARQCEPIWA